MKHARFPLFSRMCREERRWPAGLFLVSLVASLLAGVILFNAALIDRLITLLIELGLDQERGQLIAALGMTAGAALPGAALGRRRSGAIGGSLLVFCPGYLVGFLQLELRPTTDPGGTPELLNPGALLHTSLMMLALALLSAFLGAAAGAALGDVLLVPPYRSVKLLWQRHQRTRTAFSPEFKPRTKQPDSPSSQGGMKGLARAWMGLVLMGLALILASGSANLFLYGPDTGLHTVPIRPTQQGIPAHGTIAQNSLISPALGGQRRSFLVYLPPSYNTPQGRGRRYPTLYLLHGSPGHEQDWIDAGLATQSADTLIAQGKIPELIMVFPDGNGRPGQTSEWGNSGDGRQFMETFVAVDLVRDIDAHYRTLAEPADRAIGGLSMGGFGAMNIALHHPDVFGSVIALGGYYQAEGSIWGKNPAYRRANSPIDVLPSDRPAWKLRFYLGAATRDQPYYADTLQFVQELSRLHLSYQFDLQPGYHSWKVWQVQLYHALLWLTWE